MGRWGVGRRTRQTVDEHIRIDDEDGEHPHVQFDAYQPFPEPEPDAVADIEAKRAIEAIDEDADSDVQMAELTATVEKWTDSQNDPAKVSSQVDVLVAVHDRYKRPALRSPSVRRKHRTKSERVGEKTAPALLVTRRTPASTRPHVNPAKMVAGAAAAERGARFRILLLSLIHI